MRFMSFILTLAVMAVVCLCADAAPNANPGKPAMMGPSAWTYVLNQGFGKNSQLGYQLRKKVQLARGTYDYSKQGGNSVPADTVLANLMDLDGKDLVLPAQSIIKSVTVDVISTPTASAVAGFTTPQLALTLSSLGDLMAYKPVANITGLQAGVPQGGSAWTWIRGSQSNQSVVKVSMKGGSVISGKFHVFIEYYLED